MAIRRAAGDVGDAEVARVDEADELGRLVVQKRVRPHRVGRGRPEFRVTRGDVRLRFIRAIGPTAVAVGAAEADGVFEVRVLHALMTGDAAGALAGGVLSTLCEQI